LALSDDLFWMRDPLVGKLRDVDQTLDAGFDLGEGAESRKFGDAAGHDLIHLILLSYQGPGLGLEPLETEGDLTIFAIDADHVDLNLLADLQDLTRMRDLGPGKLGQMNQSVGSAQVDKGAKVTNAADHAGTSLAGLQLRQ